MRRRDLLWKALVSAGLLAILLYTQDLGGVVRLLAEAAPGWLAIATLVMVVEQSMAALVWGLLLRARGTDVRLEAILHIFFMSSFVGTWVPSSSGVDVVRTYYLARQVDGYQAVGSMLVLRAIGLLSLGLLALAGVYAAPGRLPPSVVLLAWALAAGSLAALAVGMIDWPHRLAKRSLEAVGLPAIAAAVTKLHTALRGYRSSPGALFLAAGLSLVGQLLRVVTVYASGRALGATVSFLDYLVLVPVILVITLLPVSLAGLGVREGAFVYFFGRVGMSEAHAFGTGLLQFALTLVLWVIGAGLYWIEVPSARRASR